MKTKITFAILFAITVLLLAFAYYLEYWRGIVPCPLCLLQRFCFYILAAIFLVACAATPKKSGYYTYSILTILFAIVGMAIAGRQLYLQYNPPQDTGCAADLTYLLQTFPLTQVLAKIFQGSPECATSQWSFLQLDMAGWAFIWFLIFAIVAVYILLRNHFADFRSSINKEI